MSPQRRTGSNFIFPHLLPADWPDAAEHRAQHAVHRRSRRSPSRSMASSHSPLGAGPQTDLLAISLSATDVHRPSIWPGFARDPRPGAAASTAPSASFLDSLYQAARSRDGDAGVVGRPRRRADSRAGAGDVQPRPQRVDPSARLLPALRAGLRAAKLDTTAIDIDPDRVRRTVRPLRRRGVNADSVLDAVRQCDSRPARRRAASTASRRCLPIRLNDPIARRWSHQFPATAPIDLVVTLTPFSLWGAATSHRTARRTTTTRTCRSSSTAPACCRASTRSSCAPWISRRRSPARRREAHRADRRRAVDLGHQAVTPTFFASFSSDVMLRSVAGPPSAFSSVAPLILESAVLICESQ